LTEKYLVSAKTKAQIALAGISVKALLQVHFSQKAPKDTQELSIMLGHWLLVYPVIDRANQKASKLGSSVK
jgi:hypothetical protein